MTPTSESVLQPPRPPRRWLSLALVVSTGLLISGCDSGDGTNHESVTEPNEARSVTTSGPATQPTDGSGPAGAAGEACDIVSDEVVSEVLGIEIVRREPHTDATGKSLSCTKGSKRVSDLAKVYYVSVSVLAESGTLLLDQAGKQADGAPVSGLGDKAVYLSGLGALLISDGADGIQVQVVKAGKPSDQQDAVTVAEDVLDRRE